MSTKYPDLFAALSAPFDPVKEVKKLPKGGRQLDYVTARTVMNRLDAVLGNENWWDDYSPISDSAMLCRLTVRLPDGSTITKVDAGGKAGMSDLGDDDKSGMSDAFKRAAVKFGIGRYLYKDGTPHYEPAKDEPTFNQLIAKSISFWNKHEPMEESRDRVAREHRIMNAIATAAIEQGFLTAAQISNDDGNRDASKAWKTVEALFGLHGEWVRGFLREYLKGKAKPKPPVEPEPVAAEAEDPGADPDRPDDPEAFPDPEDAEIDRQAARETDEAPRRRRQAAGAN